MPDEHLRSDSDVEEILKLALHEHPEDSATLRKRLETSALELGVTPEALKKAEEKFAQKKKEDAWLAKQKELVARKRKEAMNGLIAHAIPFFVVTIALHLINYFASPGKYWAIFPLLGWGIGFFVHAMSVIFYDYEEECKKKKKKREDDDDDDDD